MVDTTGISIHLDEETRKDQIVASLRAFLKHQTAFKEYTAKRMTPEEYATICRIVTEGFVELSIEILALEAHLGGPSHVIPINTPAAPSTTDAVAQSDSESTTPASVPMTNSRPAVSLDSPEHAQLIRQVQLLEKQKLALTVQGQKLALGKEAQEVQDQKDQEVEQQADRVVGTDDREDTNESSRTLGSDLPGIATQETGDRALSESQQLNGGVKLSVEEWQVKLDENMNSLNQVIEDINDKLADIQEAVAVLVL
ncbi:hypothetical protein BGX28_004425 [Mortierella sp. GBA30]|nr:hypothetical protein BGX28_004425 [Mortierella sp. GBA30]